MPERTRPESVTVLTAAAEAATASPSARTIEGLAVPYGAVGHSSLGPITFAAGSLTYAQTGRVKLLRQHDPDVSLGYATRLDDTDAGLWSAFAVVDGEDGDKALVEAANGARDGLSVGVLLDEAVLDQIVEKWAEGDNSPTAASGRLLEVSQVSIPAFDDARIPSAASAATTGHLTLSVAFTPPAAPAPEPPEREHAMPATTPAPAPTPAPAAVEAATAPTASPNPAVNPPYQVTAEAPVYTFNGQGPSMIRDMCHARLDGDFEAHARVNKFHAQLAGNTDQARLVTAAVETRTTEPEFIPPGYRPDLLKDAIDKGRPLFSRLNPVTLTDATPFKLPVEGDFVGVGVHTEGTAHVAEGDQTVSDVTITPVALSGAWRASRELIESTNPALDQIALRSMMRNYRDVSEARVVAALEASDATATASINTVAELRAQIDGYWNTNYESPSAIAAAPSYVTTLLGEVDTTGRPMLPSVGPTNAVGTGQAGETGFNVDGVPIFKVWGVAATMAYLFRVEDVFVGESSVRTFRFEEVEGPGVIKFALWSYVAAAVTRPGSVVKITTA